MHGALQRGARLQPRKTEPLPSPPKTALAAPTPVFLASIRETDETYRGVVAVLNDKMRVVAGSCGLQWVIQKRKNPLAWSSFAFCATKEGLLLRLPKNGHGCDPEAWVIIQALPEARNRKKPTGRKMAGFPMSASQIDSASIRAPRLLPHYNLYSKF